jgi:hypothetical protein
MEAATRVMNRRVYETIKQIATGNLVEASPADAGEVEAKPKAKKTKPKTAKKEAVTTEGE